MATQRYELSEAARLAGILEELEGTNENCGQATVQTLYGRSAPGFSKLMEFIACHVESQFLVLRSAAIDQARANYENALKKIGA